MLCARVNAGTIYWTGADADRSAAVDRMREVIGGVVGVLSTHLPADLRLGPEAGDVVVYCEAGWRFSDPAVWSNPIPGNDDHPVTEPIPFFLAGGSRRVAFGEVRTEVAHTLDVAPPIGELLGLTPPSGSYGGISRC